MISITIYAKGIHLARKIDQKRYLLFVPKIGWTVGWWEKDAYHRSGKGYWTDGLVSSWGDQETREFEPTYFSLLPSNDLM